MRKCGAIRSPSLRMRPRNVIERRWIERLHEHVPFPREDLWDRNITRHPRGQFAKSLVKARSFVIFASGLSLDAAALARALFKPQEISPALDDRGIWMSPIGKIRRRQHPAELKSRAAADCRQRSKTTVTSPELVLLSLRRPSAPPLKIKSSSTKLISQPYSENCAPRYLAQ